MYQVCGERELKLLLALDPGDTISGVARKIDENRETIRRAVNRLEDAGFVEYDDGLALLEKGVRERGLDFLAAVADVAPPTIEEAYVLPQFSGMDYAFTGIDAVYVWTRGGYQVARNPDDYPLFVRVRDSDVDAWTDFFARFGIPAFQERRPSDDVDGPLQVVLDPQPTFETDSVDGRPVVPLEETLRFAREHYATFQSAIDMLARMYDDVDADRPYRRGSA